ncbi:uncharacterized protein KY384_001734 [Bacidia gigantensis]|uniref:uncharacterized protein n=1 Tax=Bacidia gigantensis TaxID=2732470 RepID=UPI001D042D97|nr:uncharacterized protein KY384_001734 [Bacidia gigantensis]KAG8533991.1 hypothetical protein KY384_001734 [Bacidia gigantensis]
MLFFFLILPAILALTSASHNGKSHHHRSTNTQLINIHVGEKPHTFTPDTKTGAHAGDKLVFHFHPEIHSVVRSTFEQPCVPLEGGDGISSGPVEFTSAAAVASLEDYKAAAKKAVVENLSAVMGGSFSTAGLTGSGTVDGTSSIAGVTASGIAGDKPPSSGAVPNGAVDSESLNAGVAQNADYEVDK